MQNTLYYEKIMCEYENVLEKIQSKFWWILFIPIIATNCLIILLHVYYSTQNLVQN